MRFDFIRRYQGSLPQEHLCKLLNVTSRGYRAWRNRPASPRQREDMVLLAHIREQHRLSLQSYGRPRMTEELKELGLDVGHRRVGRVRRENDPLDRFQNPSHCAGTVLPLSEPANTRSQRTAITASTSRPIC
jgi:hypothetical protein